MSPTTSTHIGLAHGNGGRHMRSLIRDIFGHHLANPLLDGDADAAALPDGEGTLMCSTDGFTVSPREFPGGCLGSLAVHGTVNDLAVAGATPLYLTVNAFIEEGLTMAELERHAAALGEAARAAGVAVVAGDTKVVPRGEGSGLYLATTGIGRRPADIELGMDRIRPGDRILVSGPVGDHGTAVMLAREQFGLRGDLQSDAASVAGLAAELRALPGVRFMRDPTRGGLATVAHEIAEATGLGIELEEGEIPVNDPVQAVCEMLGFDPYFLACEGRVVAIAAPKVADDALARWRSRPEGSQAAAVGTVTEEGGRVVLRTALGGSRLLEPLEDEPLPRIC